MELLRTALEGNMFKVLFSIWIVVLVFSIIPNIVTIIGLITKKYKNIFEAGFFRFMCLVFTFILTMVIMIGLVYTAL